MLLIYPSTPTAAIEKLLNLLLPLIETMGKHEWLQNKEKQDRRGLNSIKGLVGGITLEINTYDKHSHQIRF